MDKVIIKIRKVVDGRPPDEKDANGTKSKVENDTIDLNDLVSYRKWHKSGKDDEVTGPFTQLTLKSHNKGGGMWTTRIQESEEKFEERIGQYIPVIGFA